MARITGQQGAALTNQLAQYLDQAEGNLSSDQIKSILNRFLQGSDQVTTVSGVTTTGIFKRFNEFDKVEGRTEVVTTGLWTNDVGSLTAFFTSSEQVSGSSGTYYWNVFGEDPEIEETAEPQFAVSYGHTDASGSVPLSDNDDALLPTRATYTQYRSLLLDPTDDFFSFDSSEAAGPDSRDIWVINVSRARYREKMDAGNWTMELSGSAGNVQLIDDSGQKFGPDAEGARVGRVFNVVEGQLNIGTQNAATIVNKRSPNEHGFGLFYPSHGIIVLNPRALFDKIGALEDEDGNVVTDYNDFITSRSSGKNIPGPDPDEDWQNQSLIYNSLVIGAASQGSTGFLARRRENISTSHYFVRATNREFNFSNNPTFFNADNGEFTEPSFVGNPQTYITTVGLFNEANEMLAVAKSSSPINKSFDREVLIKVKLSF